MALISRNLSRSQMAKLRFDSKSALFLVVALLCIPLALANSSAMSLPELHRGFTKFPRMSEPPPEYSNIRKLWKANGGSKGDENATSGNGRPKGSFRKVNMQEKRTNTVSISKDANKRNKESNASNKNSKGETAISMNSVVHDGMASNTVPGKGSMGKGNKKVTDTSRSGGKYIKGRHGKQMIHSAERESPRQGLMTYMPKSGRGDSGKGRVRMISSPANGKSKATEKIRSKGNAGKGINAQAMKPLPRKGSPEKINKASPEIRGSKVNTGKGKGGKGKSRVMPKSVGIETSQMDTGDKNKATEKIGSKGIAGKGNYGKGINALAMKALPRQGSPEKVNKTPTENVGSKVKTGKGKGGKGMSGVMLKSVGMRMLPMDAAPMGKGKSSMKRSISMEKDGRKQQMDYSKAQKKNMHMKNEGKEKMESNGKITKRSKFSKGSAKNEKKPKLKSSHHDSASKDIDGSMDNTDMYLSFWS